MKYNLNLDEEEYQTFLDYKNKKGIKETNWIMPYLSGCVTGWIFWIVIKAFTSF